MKTIDPVVSVIVPTFGRPMKLAALVRGLRRQTLAGGGGVEVLVGVDGADEGGAVRAAAEAAWGTAAGLVVVDGPRSGQAAVRNRLLPMARGRVLVFLNDDMVPEPGLLSAHVAAQERARGVCARGALVLGDCPWVVPEPDTMMNRLVRETSMVFFFDRMHEALRGEKAPAWDHDWGFRHGWLLNLSAPTELVREAGGLTVFPSRYGYEDDELAYRVKERWGVPVLFEPGAVARHDHFYTPEAYLEREYLLGYAAYGFARTTPGCARAMFGREITSEEERQYCAEYVRREERGLMRVRESFLKLGGMSAGAVGWVGAVGGAESASIVRMLYEHHLPLKRWEWRRGLLAAFSDATR